VGGRAGDALMAAIGSHSAGQIVPFEGALLSEERLERTLTTHVGSLVRPPELVAQLRARENGEPLDEEAFSAVLADAVDDVVRRQTEVGIDIVSDGEYGKTWTWAWYVRDRLSGFEERPWGPEGEREPSRTGKDRREFADFYA
jgi:5-methyltetrahydropteroyltriglutamate--homocysteine methyltransferase